jgi:hypothetical protein
MPKKYIPFAIAIVFLAFAYGLTRGARSEADLQLERQSIQRHLGTTIAVVNADTGTYINNELQNYSAAIIDTLEDDFVLVSPAMAETGFNSGVYGAIVTFPSDVSERILSFNANMPERVQLEFQINPALPERAFLETYVAITDLQLSINTTLANTYIASIFRQFHDAQDQVDGIFQNNLSDLMALELLTLGDFTQNLQFDSLPDLPMELRELDTNFHMNKVENFASEVASWYLNSYGLASNSFLWMREGLFRLTDNFENQEEEWLWQVQNWTNYSVEYGELLEEFATKVRDHEYDLQDWHLENANWHEELQIYSDRVNNFHDENLNWFDTAMDWHFQYLGYLTIAMEFSDEVRAYRQLLQDSIQPVMLDMTHWFEDLNNYEDSLFDQFESLLEVIEDHNMQAEVSNAFLEDLLDWHNGLEVSQESLLELQEDLNNRLSELNEWQQELETVGEQWEGEFDSFSYLMQGISIPEQFTTDIELFFFFIDYLMQIESVPNIQIPNLPEIPTINLYEPNIYFNFIAPPPLSINDIPDIENGDWNNFLNVIETTITDFEILHTNLIDTKDELHNWYTDLTDAQSQLHDWSEALETFHGEVEQLFIEVYEWAEKVLNFTDDVLELGEEFHEYQLFIEDWYTQLQTVYTSFNDLELIELPQNSEFEHLYLLEEIIVDMPEELEPLEHVVVPTWNDDVVSPESYNGAEIAEAFTSEIPLDNEALSYTPNLDPLYDEGNRHQPFAVQSTDVLFEFADMPESPLQDPPPRADDFWDSLDYMHDQLLQFNVDDFLGENINSQVSNSLNSFDNYLGTIRDDASIQFEHNLWQLDNVRHGYTWFLEDIGRTALNAQREEQQALQNSIEQFADVRGVTSDNTRQRLSSFANMMPESRAATGVNQTLVNFASSPFEFTSVGLREEVSFDHLVLQESMEEQYNTIYQIAFISVIVILIVTATFNLVYKIRKIRNSK